MTAKAVSITKGDWTFVKPAKAGMQACANQETSDYLMIKVDGTFDDGYQCVTACAI